MTRATMPGIAVTATLAGILAGVFIVATATVPGIFIVTAATVPGILADVFAVAAATLASCVTRMPT